MHMMTFTIGMCLAALSTHLCFADTAKNPSAAKNPSIELSAKASKAWLELVDKGQYNESWDQSSVLMRKTIQKDEWKELMDVTRKPLGSVSSREVLDQRTAKDPHGLPKGDYMVMYYKTAFAHKANGKELVTLFSEDGQWRVMTYQID